MPMSPVEKVMPIIWAVPLACLFTLLWRGRAAQPSCSAHHRVGRWFLILTSAVILLLGLPLNMHLSGHHQFRAGPRHPQISMISHPGWLVLFGGGFLVALYCVALEASRGVSTER